MTQQVLLVDDDAEIRSGVASYLQGFGWQVTGVPDGAAMRRLLERADLCFDAIVLDLMLPGEDGLSLLRWVQTQPLAPPVLMLTARGDTMSRVVGLEVGADDYLAKPFEPRELVARLTALVRRSGKAQAAADKRRLRFGSWQLDRLTRQLLSADGVTVPLSAAEYRLLNAFTQRPRRVLSRDQLIDMTRAPGVDVNDRSVDLAVSRLRAKLGDTAREPSLIRTVRGEGYLFDVEVNE